MLDNIISMRTFLLGNQWFFVCARQLLVFAHVTYTGIHVSIIIITFEYLNRVAARAECAWQYIVNCSRSCGRVLFREWDIIGVFKILSIFLELGNSIS